ncbi:MFS transporter [Maritalea porphyrae]|uniref:MFS transporter n=1 Tax=Maritalea porphyrae TaxID=880732 RepID=UPI0022AF3A8A|nr:MFS transporter [Maritalea porphyrae]MCZ4271852.1 MFS transporter [Maritalea porphyrae]
MRHWLLFTPILVAALGYGFSFPLLAIVLDNNGVNSGTIGLISAMPALGWLIVQPFLPFLQTKFSTKTLLLLFLSVAAISILGFALTSDLAAWFALRFIFGGSLGLFFRVGEYWVNVVTKTKNRGRITGAYSFSFFFGIALGSLIQPEIGQSGFFPFLSVSAALVLGGLLILPTKDETVSEPVSVEDHSNGMIPSRLLLLLPLAAFGVIVYGVFEDIPAYLISVYALRVGFEADIAAYTLTAFALGGLVFPMPIGILSDRIGRQPTLTICAVIGAMGAVALPFALSSATAFLLVLFVWGGCVSCIYSVTISMIGDRYKGKDLANANAGFGMFYALAALIGPILNGFSMQAWEPHGLFVPSFILFTILSVFSLTWKLGAPKNQVPA